MALSKKEQVELDSIESELTTPQQQQPPAEPRGQLQALGSALAQGVSGGFSDELGAGIGSVVSGLSETVSNFINGDMEFADFTALYDAKVKEAREINAQDEANFPKTFMAGKVAGGIGSAVIPGGPAARLAQVAGTGIKGAIATGAALTGLQAAGESEAPVTSTEFAGEVAQGALLGGATGGLLQGAGTLIGKGLSKALPKTTAVAADKISPKAISADLRKLAKMSVQKTGGATKEEGFSQGANKNLETALTGLQKRGVIPETRSGWQATNPKDLALKVDKESKILGEGIRDVVALADDSGVDFGSNKLGIDKLKSTFKDVKRSITSDEFNTTLDEVNDALSNQTFKASDLAGLKSKLDDMVGGKLAGSTTLKSQQLNNIKAVRGDIKRALEKHVGEAAKKNPQVQELLEQHGVKTFADLNDAAADAMIVKKVTQKAFEEADAALGAAEAIPLGQQTISSIPDTAIGVAKGLGKFVAGKRLEPTVRATSVALRKAVELEQRSATVARTLYSSMDEDNILNDEADRKAHATRVLNNNTLPHAQKFREINQLQTSGKINPDSIPARDVKSTLKRLEEERQAENLLIMQQLGM